MRRGRKGAGSQLGKRGARTSSPSSTSRGAAASKIDENVQRDIINHMSLRHPDIIQFKEVGRMAGQFAKPRSNPTEAIDGVTVLSYRDDIINSDTFDEKSCSLDPERLIRAYSQSGSTLNLLRGFAPGGYADLQRVTQWNLDFLRDNRQGDRY
ncbi:hypothetical protein GUJ93_ZPchr0012g20730 [Zizania palustris]|uniref:Phospho-2-dehydro-3-deoxyheptonate aldolase n=1 Tax=Zizania palustris TaxID=103762 RepID=A0A8J5WMQ5_ZIZPA|nr:hypothetical protein GUJ93_ZPchr0012g20730 [Zizania palustris]